MIDPVQGLSSAYPGIRATGYTGREKVKEEFLTIFYKEIFKQVFKAPDLSPGEDKDNSSEFVSGFNSDLMVEQMAQLMAQKSFAGMPNFIPVEEAK